VRQRLNYDLTGSREKLGFAVLSHVQRPDMQIMNCQLHSRAFSGARFINSVRLSFAALLLFPALAQNASATGSGTEDSPYLFSDSCSFDNPLDSGYYKVTASDLYFNGEDTPWYIGKTTSGNVLTIDSAGTGLDVYPGFCLGDAAGSEGTLNVTGETTVNTWSLYVGWSGSGTMNITAGAKVNVNGGGTDFIGGCTMSSSSGGTGKVVISGSGSKLTTSNVVEIGRFGTGTVEITGGGAFEATQYDVYVGYNRVSLKSSAITNNVVTVSGSDALGNSSAFIVAATLYLGWDNQGTLILSDGGLAKIGALSINGDKYGFGILYMDGGYLALAGELTSDAINTILSYTRVGNSSSYASAVLDSNIYYTYFSADSGQMIGGYDVSNYTVIYTTAIPVPEPATYALFGALGALGLVLRRRRK
jgi:T5SS/PEP-CTERM-associated repeat protein